MMTMKWWWWWNQWLLFRRNLDCGLWLKRERMCGLTCLLGNVPHFIIWHRVDNVIRWSQIGWHKASQNIAWRMCSVNMKGGDLPTLYLSFWSKTFSWQTTSFLASFNDWWKGGGGYPSFEKGLHHLQCTLWYMAVDIVDYNSVRWKRWWEWSGVSGM